MLSESRSGKGWFSGPIQGIRHIPRGEEPLNRLLDEMSPLHVAVRYDGELDSDKVIVYLDEVGALHRRRLEGKILKLVDETPAIWIASAISDPHPRPAFFRLVKKEQARWCKTASESIKNKVRRKVSTWISPAVVYGDIDRYHDRALCFTGILFINGKMIPHHNWPKY